MRRIGLVLCGRSARNNSTCAQTMGRYGLMCLVLETLLALTASTGDMPIKIYPSGPRPRCSHQQQYVAKANRMFAADLYTKVWAVSGSDSIILSPFSISAALAITHSGAAGETKSQMLRTLHLNSVPSVCSVNQGFSHLLTAFSHHSESSHSINVLNKLYIESEFGLLRSYRQLTSDYYHTTPVKMPFSKFPDDCREYINRWANMETNDTILSLIPPDAVRSDTVIVLSSAVTFSGNWLHDFYPPLTTNEPFNPNSLSHVSVPMMRMSCIPKFRYAYVDRIRAHVVELPYYHSSFAMYIDLPEEGVSLKDIESSFIWNDPESLGLTSQYVAVSIPKFSLTKGTELTPMLKELGMTDLFVENVANLSGIASGDSNKLWLQNVFHKAHINVNETGTGASPATFDSLCENISSQEPHVKFIADRPFLFYIWDTVTKSLLYNGRFTG